MKPMTKNMWREIGANLGRFIAIILIILLGTLIFVGVKAAGPGLNDSMHTTVTQSHLSDVQLLSTTGFTQADVTTAEKVAGAKAETVKFKFVTGGTDDNVVALYGYTKGATQNRLTLRAGHLPTKAGEIVLDERARRDFGYHLGDTYRFDASAQLKRRSYTVVGFADSPLYIDYASRGAANVGDGTVRYFAYIPAAQMNLSVATLLNVRFADLQTVNTYSDAYTDRVETRTEALKRVFKPRAAARTKALLATATKQLDAQQAQLDAGQAQLEAAQAQLAAQSGGAVTSTPALAAQQAQLAASQKQLTAARQRAEAAAKTTYTWQTRADLSGFTAYGDSSERIAAIANVFPVFFFLIAALITFTTITRMVEEARGQIGTFKALGYTKWAIARNYLTYALMAGVIGATLGGVIGNLTLPRLVISLYHQCIPMVVTVPFMWGIFALAMTFALLATVGAAIIVVRRELAEKPAALMRPRAPKSAKRILLERITPLWRRLSFHQKVSYRNLFRYKSRMVMTIVGIAGGTALLLTGFGLRDSISATATAQYGGVFHYDALVALKQAGHDQAARTVLAKDARFQSAAAIATTVGKATANGAQINEVNLFTPLTTTHFDRYVTLSAKLPARGLIISRKIAVRLGVKAGAHVTFTPTNGAPVRVRVAAVTPNYMGVFAYMSPAAYRAAFGQPAKVSGLLVRLKAATAKQQDRLAHALLADGEALGTSFTSDQLTSIDTMAQTMTPVVLIFILLSGVLSFVVLYNLTNINVSERIRELSTIKVLGFFDREVTMYIVRENIVMTLIGIVFGYGAGWALLAFILKQAATPMVIFPVVIRWPGMVAATLLMIAFTAIVMGVTHRKLRRVDMIEALKSNE
ncbi:ABC transporter permease [Lacticaseibacillus daqingensis]|uniref:ABC transporter permease n=1 Tax=Lacticaseibacillus daqingensis TaxID=2486014 RepID=UPI000F7A420B|nr:FtsX-like permease family protein [Lacticaseibacillus daqingensis]